MTDDPSMHDEPRPETGDVFLNAARAELIRGMAGKTPEQIADDVLGIMRSFVIESQIDNSLRRLLGREGVADHETSTMLHILAFLITTRFDGRLRLDGAEIETWLSAIVGYGFEKTHDVNGSWFTLAVTPIKPGESNGAARHD